MYEVYTEGGWDMLTDSYEVAVARLEEVAVDGRAVVVFDKRSIRVMHARGDGIRLYRLLGTVVLGKGNEPPAT